MRCGVSECPARSSTTHISGTWLCRVRMASTRMLTQVSPIFQLVRSSTKVRLSAPPARRAIIGAAQSSGSRTWLGKTAAAAGRSRPGRPKPRPVHPPHATSIDGARPDHPNGQKRHRLKPRLAQGHMTA